MSVVTISNPQIKRTRRKKLSSRKKEGVKLDFEKPDTSLLIDFGQALLAVSEVGTFGKNKYVRGGWIHVTDGVNRYTAALMRHVLSENTEKFDSESGLLHAAHCAWNALARLELMLKNRSEVEKKNEFI